MTLDPRRESLSFTVTLPHGSLMMLDPWQDFFFLVSIYLGVHTDVTFASAHLQRAFASKWPCQAAHSPLP
jgi:hypothetical protein